MKITTKDLFRILRERARPWLTGSQGNYSKFYNSVREIYPVHSARSKKDRLRFNLLLPTSSPEKIYGGIATALKIANEIISELPGNIDIRVIITSDIVNSESVTEIAKRLGKTFFISRPNVDVEGCLVVNLYEFRYDPIFIRENDIFFATAWWTADLGFRLIDMQKLMFGQASDLIYLIQDFEPGFYQWSNHYALCEATYHRGNETIALMNSEELFDFMVAKYSFKDSYLIPFAINQEIAKSIKACEKEKVILVYGRPSTPRNCFEIIVEALRLWQYSEPAKNLKYQIIFVGELFSNSLVDELENTLVQGKLALDDYADLLSRSAIGISLMISPHPSYPPLEMSYAGCITITNGFENKNLALHYKNILNIDHVSPQRLARELENAVKYFESGSIPFANPRKKVRDLDFQYAKQISQKVLASTK